MGRAYRRGARVRVVVDANPLFPLSESLGPTGVGRWTAGAISALAREAPDWEIDLLAFHMRRTTLDTSWMGPNVSFRLVRFSNRLHRRLMVARVMPALENFVGPADAMIGPAFVSWPTKDAAELPVVHDLTWLRYPEFVSRRNLWYLRVMMPRVLRRAALVLTVSESIKSEITERLGVPPELIRVVPNGCDLADSGRGEISPDVPASYFLFVGTLEPRKNLQGVLTAHRKLRSERSDVPPLVVVGGLGWRSGEIPKLIHEEEASGNLITLGYVPDQSLLSLYENAIALVFPSFYEGFGLPALEAMAAGTPVIASDRGGLPEVVGHAGLVIDPDDPSAIAEAMERVLIDPELRSSLRLKGIERAESFTWAHAGVALRGAIEESIRARTHRRN